MILYDWIHIGKYSLGPHEARVTVHDFAWYYHREQKIEWTRAPGWIQMGKNPPKPPAQHGVAMPRHYEFWRGTAALYWARDLADFLPIC